RVDIACSRMCVLKLHAELNGAYLSDSRIDVHWRVLVITRYLCKVFCQVQSYYHARDVAGTAKTSIQGMECSSALTTDYVTRIVDETYSQFCASLSQSECGPALFAAGVPVGAEGTLLAGEG